MTRRQDISIGVDKASKNALASQREAVSSRIRMDGSGWMPDYKVRYKNSRFSHQKVELDGQSFIHCEFENCMVILERGETEVSGCRFNNCKLMLKGNAYVIGKIIKFFTGASPLKVLDLEEPLFEGTPSLPKSPEESPTDEAGGGVKGEQGKENSPL